MVNLASFYIERSRVACARAVTQKPGGYQATKQDARGRACGNAHALVSIAGNLNLLYHCNGKCNRNNFCTKMLREARRVDL